MWGTRLPTVQRGRCFFVFCGELAEPDRTRWTFNPVKVLVPPSVSSNLTLPRLRGSNSLPGSQCQGSQSPQPHLEDCSTYRATWPTELDSNPRCLQLPVTLTPRSPGNTWPKFPGPSLGARCSAPACCNSATGPPSSACNSTSAGENPWTRPTRPLVARHLLFNEEMAGNRSPPVYSHGCKSPLPVAELRLYAKSRKSNG